MNRKSETPGNFGCPKGVEKSELFSQATYHSQNFRYETLKPRGGTLQLKIRGELAR